MTQTKTEHCSLLKLWLQTAECVKLWWQWNWFLFLFLTSSLRRDKIVMFIVVITRRYEIWELLCFGHIINNGQAFELQKLNKWVTLIQ